MPDDLFASAGSLRDHYEAFDWSATPFGPVEGWSRTLRSTVRLMLSTKFACTLMWGPDYAMVYNESYVEMIGDKHPAAIGAPARVVFDEAWSIIGPMMEHVTIAHEATWVRDELVPLERDGFLEECYFTFSYSPVPNDDGVVEGILDIAADTTLEVLARRRLALLSTLRASLAELGQSPEAAEAAGGPERALAARALAVLRDHPRDFAAVELRGSGVDRLPAGLGSALPDAPATPLDPGQELTLESLAVGGAPMTVAWMPLPTSDPAAPLLLVAALSPALAPDAAYVAFLHLVAGSIGQAMHRASNLSAERAVALSEREFSESLQRSLLGSPVEPDHVRVAARYAPATDQDEIGGDWHDSFLSADGALHLVIGDVSGHDRAAAVAMGQARNVLRGISFALDRPPGATLEAFEEAIAGLGLGTYITGVLARVEQSPEQAVVGRRTLRWSNAGHPPPLLLGPDGSTRFLEESHEPMLGFLTDHPRSDATVEVAPGSALVLYTDGLVERRGVGLDDTLEELRRTAADAHHLDAEALADHLLAHAGAALEDDVALMVVRFLAAESA